jgi:hypothetical protein
MIRAMCTTHCCVCLAANSSTANTNITTVPAAAAARAVHVLLRLHVVFSRNPWSDDAIHPGRSLQLARYSHAQTMEAWEPTKHGQQCVNVSK